MLTYILATLRDSNMILCINLQKLYTEGLECLRRRLLLINVMHLLITI